MGAAFRFALTLFLFSCSLLSTSLRAADSPPFQSAQTAYDEGRYPEAISTYQGMLEQGLTDKALFYNLGNALFRSGQVAKAILNYRRAWHLDPLDPDINKNLDFALNHAGAIQPAPSWRKQLFSNLRFAQWVGIGVAAWWGGMLLLGISCFSSALSRQRRNIAVTTVILLLVATGGIWHTSNFDRNREVVIQQDDVQALFAPVAGSTPHFSLKQGSIAILEEDNGVWLKIRAGADRGWIPSRSCAKVFVK